MVTDKSLKPYVLIVEDEEAITRMLEYNLEKNDFDVEMVDDGEKALISVEGRKPDVILLDWLLPTLTGIEVCKRLRENEETRLIPVIMLTARGEEDDRILGLDSGADDYIVKPFSPKELIARIHAVLRRVRPILSDKIIEYAGLTVDIASHKASYNDSQLHLGPTEFRLLVYMMEHPGQVFSREQLLDAVWGQDIYVENRTVDVHIRRLRKAMSDVCEGLDLIIQTIRSAGYVLQEPE